MDIIILVVVLLCDIFLLWKLYEPKIEVVVLIKHYRIYLWYNKWEGGNFKGRAYKYLFEI